MQEVATRKELILAEYHQIVPDDMLLFDFMYASEAAFKRREDRRKAAQEGKQFHG